MKRAAALQILTEKERSAVAHYSKSQIVKEIPNYVMPFSKDSERPSWWRSSFEGKTTYVFLGRIHEKKGCIEFLDAWADLCQSNSEFAQGSVLVFCGWIDGLTGFEAHLEQVNVQFGNVFFAGPQYGEEKSRTLAAASFFVLPSKSEGLPVAILEAWSAGIPVIMTPECNLSVGFSREAALETGFNRHEIVASLFEASRMSLVDRDRMGARGAEIVRELYSRQKVGDALLALYRESTGSMEITSQRVRDVRQ
ncbi:glycosyltransferase [Rhizobium sp. XQZ8]|uniref:glycosyltransferase n=1 Tax=Rhizobium populisoli TaxID=2859785 RepID=UPI001CA5AAC0|nr:glycosyltransferase [Rhizobium populisoli]MBW6420398.1 glycosyltransferase [Rhizobium populisoli]